MPIEIRIVEIYRYLIDGELFGLVESLSGGSGAIENPPSKHSNYRYCYDILGAKIDRDGQGFKMKVAVAPNLHDQIRSGKWTAQSVLLLAGDDSLVTVKEKMGDTMVEKLILVEAKLLSQSLEYANNVSIAYMQSLPFFTDEAELENYPDEIREELKGRLFKYIPYMGMRHTYLDLYSDNDYCHSDPAWRGDPMNDDFAICEKLDVYGSLQKMLDGNLTPLASPTNSPTRKHSYNGGATVIARVIAKSGLKYFGRPNDSRSETSQMPYQFYLIVSDSSRELQVTFWGKSVQKYFNPIKVGDFIMVSGYKVRKIPNYLKKPVISMQYEIVVNDIPYLKIYKWSYDQFLDHPIFNTSVAEISQRFPLPSCHLPSYSELVQYVEDNETRIDLIGRISYLSRIHFEVFEKMPTSCYRWVQIDNNGNETCIMVKLYGMTQSSELCSLEPGSIIHVSNVRAKCIQISDETMPPASYYYCVSSFTSSISSYPSPLQLPAWIRNNTRFREFVKNIPKLDSTYLVGGYFDLPPMPKLGEKATISSFSQIQNLCGNLWYKERQRVYLNGKLRAVRFQHSHSHEISSETQNLRLKDIESPTIEAFANVANLCELKDVKRNCFPDVYVTSGKTVLESYFHRIHPVALQIADLNDPSMQSLIYFVPNGSDPLMATRTMSNPDNCLTFLLAQLIQVVLSSTGKHVSLLDDRFPSPNSPSLNEIMDLLKYTVENLADNTFLVFEIDLIRVSPDIVIPMLSSARMLNNV